MNDRPGSQEASDSQVSETRVERWWSRLHGRVTGFHRRAVPRAPEYEPGWWRQKYLLTVFVMRRFFVEDRCNGMAAILTIDTLLSMVPIIGVALLVIGLMDDAAGARFVRDVFHAVVPETSRARELASEALRMASNVTIRNLGTWGFLATLAIAFLLFQTLEVTFNRVWRVTRKRSMLVKFTMFYTLATLGPILVLYSFAQPFLPSIAGAGVVPVLATTGGLVLLNRFLPYTAVRWRAALVGGATSALLIEIGKLAFGFYASRVSTYEGLYGPLAVLPILIVWSFLSWSFVLIGAELAFVVQHRRAIALLGYMNRYVLNRRMIQRPSSRTAARIMLAICDRYVRHRLGLTADELAERFGLGHDLTTEIIDRLQAEGLLVCAEHPAEVYVPGRPLAQIRVLDVLVMFEQEHARRLREDPLGAVLAAADRAREAAVGPLTFADLVEQDRP